MIKNPNAFVTVMRTSNLNPRVENYVEDLQTSYDKMKLPRVGLRIEEVGQFIDSQSKICTSITSMKEDKTIEELSAKLKEVADLIDAKYETRIFHEEVASSQPIVQVASQPKNDEIITTDP